MSKIIFLIRQIRLKKGMSIRTLSQKSGVSHTEVSRIESGEVSPSLETLLRMADALRVDIKNTFDVVKERDGHNGF